jgi:S1-C subfamily serine protease
VNVSAFRVMFRSIVATAMMLGLAAPGMAQLKLPRQIAQEAFESVVLLVMQDSNGQPTSFGSGFVLRDGLVATNNHVIKGAASGYCKLVGRRVTYPIAGIIAQDTAHDLSILAVTGIRAPGLPVGNSGEVAVGDAVYAIGNPEGLEGTFSQGVVSGIRHFGNDNLLQITAPISSGSSGGPILDSSGKIIGIAVATLKEGQTLNLAIPSSYLTELSTRISANARPLVQRSAAEMLSTAQSTRQPDISPSIPDLRPVAERGDASAQISLGRAYLFGQGVPKDAAVAFKWYRKRLNRDMFSLSPYWEPSTTAERASPGIPLQLFGGGTGP